MKISDLPAPITAAKADWLPGTHWIGFTPTNESGEAREARRSAIARQAGDGYIIEYVTLKMDEPNPGHENDPKYLEEKKRHKELAGRFIAVHKLRPTSRGLLTLLGKEEYEKLQDKWASNGKRYRWSVAFPIIESYRIITQPKANEILDASSMQRLFGHPSGTLRPLNDKERLAIAELPLEPINTLNAWIAIEDEIVMAEGSQIDIRIENDIDNDLQHSAMEGFTEEQKRKVKKRAAWLAQKFINKRKSENTLYCDTCNFNPTHKIDGTKISPKTLLDVHHIKPIEEGIRRTTLLDFVLLCPNCHRLEHAMLKIGRSLM